MKKTIQADFHDNGFRTKGLIITTEKIRVSVLGMFTDEQIQAGEAHDALTRAADAIDGHDALQQNRATLEQFVPIIATLIRFQKEGATTVNLSALMDDSETQTIGQALAALPLAGA